MRVVQVIARLNVGGPAALVLSVAEGAPFEFEVKVLAGEVQAGEADHRDVRGASVAVLTVPGLGRSIRPADDFRALAHLYRSLRALRPDIVHTHTAKAGVLGRAVALASGGSRLVHTFHGHLLYGYFGAPARAGVMAAERALACVTDRIVAVGERVRDDLLRAGVGRPEQYEVIAPGVELPAPPPTRAEARRLLGLPPGARVVGFTGRLIRIKRPDRIVELARRLPDAVVVIAGEGSLYPEVAATAPRNLRLLGWRPDVQVVHAACDLAVLTSDNEGMPLSLIEAALCGVPAVTTAVGSAGEVVLDGETGLVVDVDPATFADAVGRLLADDGLRLRMGLAARVRAETEFSVRRMVDAHVHLYQRILHEKPLKASRR